MTWPLVLGRALAMRLRLAAGAIDLLLGEARRLRVRVDLGVYSVSEAGVEGMFSGSMSSMSPSASMSDVRQSSTRIVSLGEASSLIEAPMPSSEGYLYP